MNYLLLKTKTGYDEYPLIKSVTVADEIYRADELLPYIWQKTSQGTEYLYLAEMETTYKMPENLTISSKDIDPDAILQIAGLNEKILITQGILYREYAKDLETDLKETDIYLNNELLPKLLTNADSSHPVQEIEIKTGDTLLIGSTKLSIYRSEMVINAADESYETKMPTLPARGTYPKGFPRYKRSPRLIKRIPSETVEIKKPPSASKMPAQSLVQLIATPLVTMGVTVGISIMLGRGLFILMSVAATLMALVTSIIKYLNDKKDHQATEEKRQEIYEQYLIETRKKINLLREKEIDALKYNNPAINAIESMINSYSSRIYERNIRDDDFLTISLGTGKEKISTKIKAVENELELKTDDLDNDAKIIKSLFETIPEKPVTVDLKRGHLGLVGEKNIIHEQLKILVSQIAFFHSYHDVQIINIFNEKYNDDFLWMNFLPHLRISAINTYGSINNEKMKEQLLGSIYQILKDRKLRLDENKKEQRFLPHYLIILDEPKLLADHPIMEYLDGDGTNMGFSIISTTYLKANLPENISTILMLDHSEQGTLLLSGNVMVDKKLKLSRIGDVNLEWMARNLSVLIHEVGIVSNIPDSISFFEMYKIEHPHELNSPARWKKNESHKSLSVPLGVRAPEDYVSLNLHERAHGPHGLVAGTTGSGKSEIVQSYLLSLAVNYHPYEVGYLIIDFKGGGMAGLFDDLPHMLGTITNLDGSESNRAMASIKAELERRQRVFSRNNVNHINSYNKLFKSGEVSEPIPHLFIVSDEFAQLKQEQPEFLTELVSAARIGRSLGIHLILATQKPTGVVNEQILSNTRFKLALKVADEADSREMLKTPDAAFITQPGRAYLQVGANEIYEVFQSAWSGATYNVQGAQTESTDNRVYLLNDLGQGEVLNEDLSDTGDSNKIKATELDVVVKYLKETFINENVPSVRKPWLPPLATRIISPNTIPLKNVEDIESKESEQSMLDLSFALGMADIPEQQSQSEYILDLLKEGNIAFFAASGFGKSFALMTIILSLAIKNSVDDLNFYILDFGNSALISLNALPHTSDYITFSDRERLDKFIRIIEKEINDRKELFAAEMVQNFYVYNQSASINEQEDKKLKAIIVAVDNYDVVKEAGDTLDDALMRLARDGASLGIYMIVTASKLSGIRQNTINNYKIKLAGFLFDAGDAAGIVGRSKYQIPEIKGRAFVKLTDGISIMQIYSMVPFKNDVDYNVAVKKLLDAIKRMYPTKKAIRIPILPNRFWSTLLNSYNKAVGTDIAIGLEKEDVILQGIRRFNSPFAIVGDAAKGKTNMLKVILSQVIKETEDIYVFDSKSMGLYSFMEDVNYVDNEEKRIEFVDELTDEVERREESIKTELSINSKVNPRELIENALPFYILIDDIDDFMELYKGKESVIAALFNRAAESGITIIITIHVTKPKSANDILRWIKTANYGLLLSTLGSFSIFTSVLSKDIPVRGSGLLFKSGAYEKLMLPEYVDENISSS